MIEKASASYDLLIHSACIARRKFLVYGQICLLLFQSCGLRLNTKLSIHWIQNLSLTKSYQRVAFCNISSQRRYN